uniref:CFAP65 fourth Ig-like domain-containing protein n=1 Tax=Dendroctonus ponderosae TaxID=77166 RepID=A0AAR5P6K5_DENPD
MLSVNRLQFGGRGERKVELRNASPTSARFQIHHPEGDAFQVRPLEGVVAPHGYAFLSVRFSPPRGGVFVRKIFCLVWNCEPLMLHLAGGEGVGPSPTPIDELCGFAAYFEEGAVTVEPPSFDVGFAPTPSTLLANISNQSAKTVQVDWRQQTGGRVVVAPPTVEVPPLGRQQIQLQLAAAAPYGLLHETLLGQVDAATCLSLYVQAHSFPANQQWISHVQLLPETVYWPPCAPGDVANTTFLMRNRSHLPVQFRLESPKATNIRVKPRMGVFRHWQIVAVRLQTEQGAAKAYMEAWQVVVNGRALPLYFHGLTCVPRVEIGRGNRIDAGAVQDGSQKEVEVPMRNSSLCPVDFQFQLGKMVGVSPMTGRLPPNETLTLVVKVTGSQCAPTTERFHCLLRIVDASGAVTGHSHDLPVDIVAECSYSQLCACPSSEDFGRVPFGHRLKCQFDASNFGNTAVYFQACQSGEDKNIHIRPSFGEVKARESQRFMVGGVASIVGGATLSFGYYNRLVKDSPLVTGTPTALFTLRYEAEFPIVQIEGVVEHNFGALFARRDLYEAYLGVAALNHALRHVANDQTLEHRSRLPELPVDGEQEFWARLTLGNVSDFDTDVTLKRLKLCDCTMQEISGGLSKRGRGFQCPHRPALSITPLALSLPAGASKVVNIVVKYGVAGATPLGFALRLSNNRTVLWHFEVYGVDGSALQWLLVVNPVDEIQPQTRKPLL